MRLRIRRRAKKELLDIDDDAVFFAVVRAILDLEANPRPRGQPEVYRIWVGRDWRVLYSKTGGKERFYGLDAISEVSGRIVKEESASRSSAPEEAR